MRAIGVVPTEQDAQRLASYLLTIGIASQIDLVADGYCVWIRDEDKLDLARQELAAYLSNPKDARYSESQQSAEQIRVQQLKAQEKYQKNVRDIRGRWWSPTPQSCPLTIGVIAICVAVAIVTQFGEQHQALLNYLFISPMLNGQWFRPGLHEIREGQIWRLITPIFIHFNTLHILFNLMNFYILGGVIEIVRGTWRLASMILAIAAVSNLVQYLYHDPAFGGMSGVVYGLFGYIWMKSRFDPNAGMYLRQETVTIMIVWLFLCMTGFVGRIANAAHVSGLVAGMIMGITPILWRRVLR